MLYISIQLFTMGDPDYIDVTRLNESEEEDTEDVSGTPVKRWGKIFL